MIIKQWRHVKNIKTSSRGVAYNKFHHMLHIYYNNVFPLLNVIMYIFNLLTY